MGKRPRTVPVVLEKIAQDELAFIKNKSSENARKISTKVEYLEIDIWFDKHYLNRVQHGDENGLREGIEQDDVKKIVESSVKHLLYYSVKLKYFIFVNHDDENRFGRIVLQTVADNQTLNIVIECHYLSLNKYEITVKTAMCEDNFRMSEGQFIIELVNDEESYLKKKDGSKIKKISSYLK